MPIERGKYDWICTKARKRAKAKAALLIVIDGLHGTGASVQAPLEILLKMPDFLRLLASDIERDIQ